MKRTNFLTTLVAAMSLRQTATPTTADAAPPTGRRALVLTGAGDAARSVFSEAVCASAAIPIVFSPVILSPRGGEPGAYADGGAENAPIGVARHLGASEIVGITARAPSTLAAVSTLNDVVMQAYAANQNRLIFAQLADGTTGTRLQTCNLIAPGVPLDFNDQAKLVAAFARGVDAQLGAVPVPAGIPMT